MEGCGGVRTRTNPKGFEGPVGLGTERLGWDVFNSFQPAAPKTENSWSGGSINHSLRLFDMFSMGRRRICQSDGCLPSSIPRQVRRGSTDRQYAKARKVSDLTRSSLRSFFGKGSVGVLLT